MRRTLIVAAVLAAAAIAGLGYATRPTALSEAEVPSHSPNPEAGALLFAAGSCASCHAAPGATGEDKLVLAGGLELKTAFGTFVAPNISPDPEHGIGAWSEAEFLSAMLKGTSPDGRHYYPAFPYTSFARTDPSEMLDLFAYIRGLPASDNVAPGHDLRFPYNLRAGIGLWKLLNLDPDPVLPVPEDPLLARGQELVEGIAHCGECHTPRDPLGGLRHDAWLAGGPNPDGPGSIPNITPHDAALSWSKADIAYYLETGFTPDFDSAGGSMARVIEGTSRLRPEDREAIAAYLKAVPPVPPNS